MSKINKVLMLAHPELDHLQYMIYDGLYKVLGKDNLVVYPYVNHFSGSVDQGYILDDGKRGYTEAPGYVSKHETPLRSFEDLAQNIHSFDIIYLCSGRTYAVQALDQFIAICGRGNLPPIIFSEGEDYQSFITIRHIKNKYHPAVCFKREYIQDEINRNGGDLHPIYPLPFCAVTDNMPPDNENKDIDVFGIFGSTFPIREHIVRLLNTSPDLSGYNVYVGINNFSNPIPNNKSMLPYQDYLKLMARAKINVVARGWGNDSVRRFEAMCYSGLVMSDNLPTMTPEPFVDKQHIVYYNNDLSGLIEQIKHYLNNNEDRKRIGKAGREHCMVHHTTQARVQQFLSRIEGHI